MTTNQTLKRHMDTIDTTIREKAKELSYKRSRIVYTLHLMTMDEKNDRAENDVGVLSETFVFEMYEESVELRSFANDHVNRKKFQRKRGVALRCELMVTLESDDTLVSARTLQFSSTGKLAWDAKELRVHNSLARLEDEDEDWHIDVDYDADSNLQSITLLHIPRRCSGIFAILEPECIRVQEDRLLRLLDAVPLPQEDIETDELFNGYSQSDVSKKRRVGTKSRLPTKWGPLVKD